MLHEDHRLLLRHFENWLAKKRLTLDVGLVGVLLELRATYDDLEPTRWEAGSVEDLLLARWPAKGAADPPDVGVLVDALEGWFKFLRSTGRMSARSADVKELVKEVRRAAPRMAEAAEDRSGWSPTKVLMDWGRRQGIAVDGAPDAESLQQRLDEVQHRWNELPVHERVRLMPSPEFDSMTGRERRAHAGNGDPIVGLLLDFTHQLPSGSLPEPSVTGPQFAAAPYLQQVMAFAVFAGRGRRLTPRDNLRLADARELYDQLGLDAWERGAKHLQLDPEVMPGVAAVGLDAYVERELARSWRSAADIMSIERLWWGALGAGLVEVRDHRLVGHPKEPADDDGWLELGIRATYELFNWLEDRESSFAVIVQALMRSYIRHCSPVGWDELDDFAADWLSTPAERRPDQRFWRTLVRHALWQIADLGIAEVSDQGVRLTEAGDVFITWWLKQMERR